MSFPLSIGAIGLALTLTAFASSASGCPKATIRLGGGESDGSAGSVRPVVTIRDVPVPREGALVTINAHAHGLPSQTRLAALFLTGNADQAGTSPRTLRSAISAPRSVVDALVRDPNATLEIVVCRGDNDCTTTSNVAVAIQRGGATP